MALKFILLDIFKVRSEMFEIGRATSKRIMFDVSYNELKREAPNTTIYCVIDLEMGSLFVLVINVIFMTTIIVQNLIFEILIIYFT